MKSTDRKIAAIAAILDTLISRGDRLACSEVNAMRRTLADLQGPGDALDGLGRLPAPERSVDAIVADIRAKHLSVPCPRCKASPGKRCTTPRGDRVQTHAGRQEAARA